MSEVHYAFLSKLIPEQMYEQTLRRSRKNMQDAANALQWNLYNGLSKNLEREITLLNLLPVHSWPQYYSRPWVNGGRFDATYSENNKNIGFCNIKGLRKSSQQRHTCRVLKTWCREHPGRKVVFVYTLSAVAMKAIKKIRKEYPDLTVCVIIADLPDMISLQKKGALTAFADKNTARAAYACQKEADCFALLTKHMAQYMGIDCPWCVVEGIATTPEEKTLSKQQDDYKTILYAGTLHRRFGVMHLVEAFRGIAGEDYRLLICGNGDSVEAIRQAEKQDGRIQYLGQLPRKEVLALQKKVTVVVNPRQGNEEFTKYSFPSKNMEYLSSGTPLIAYRLDGIPEEYAPYIFYVEDDSLAALREKIVQVCSMSAEERAEHGCRAREFVLTQKNDVVQTRKILDMVEALLTP